MYASIRYGRRLRLIDRDGADPGQGSDDERDEEHVHDPDGEAPRDARDLVRSRTRGLSVNAMTPAVRNRKMTWPSGRTSMIATSRMTGSPTSWIQRGIVIRGCPSSPMPVTHGRDRNAAARPPPCVRYRQVMPTPHSRHTARLRASRRRAQRRGRQLAVLVFLGALAVVTLLLTAFGSGSPRVADTSLSGPAVVPPVTARPEPRPLATVGNLQILVPVAASAVTGIGYHAGSGGALDLKPAGRQANEGIIARLWRGITGTGDGGPVWFQLGDGPGTAVAVVGATVGTDVYAPVNGTVVAISDAVVGGTGVGSRIDIRPTLAPALVLSVTYVHPDPVLTVGLDARPGELEDRDRGRHRVGRAPGTGRPRPRPREQRRPERLSGQRLAAVAGRRSMRILFVGDVVGRPGRDALEARLHGLRTELEVDVCIVNGENVADGAGITPRLAHRLLAAGADAITLGNHTWRRPEIGPMLQTSDRIVRPANLSSTGPGRGLAVVRCDAGAVAVVNVMGSLSLDPSRSMWEIVDDLVDEARRETPVVVVDVHAEATSEKIALASWLDGRVTAVLGTHTHVQTADARILPKGTAAMTDVGMTGPHDSVIGVKTELATQRMRTGMPVRFETAEGGVRIEGALVTCEPTGRATAIEAVRVPVP